MNQENHEDDISDVQDALSRLSEKVRAMTKKISEMEREQKQMSEFRANAEVRIRMAEVDLDRFSKDFSEMDKRLRIFELNHDNGKERWKMIVNFVVQLVWVSMAAFLLAKLGLQPPI